MIRLKNLREPQPLTVWIISPRWRRSNLTMVFKLAKLAESHWRTLNGSVLLEEVFQGIKFVDGTKELAA